MLCAAPAPLPAPALANPVPAAQHRGGLHLGLLCGANFGRVFFF